VYGYPQVTAENAVVNSAWDRNSAAYGMVSGPQWLDGIRISSPATSDPESDHPVRCATAQSYQTCHADLRSCGAERRPTKLACRAGLSVVRSCPRFWQVQSIGLMVYQAEESMQYVKDYANATAQWDG
jgi:hypothetical protein